MNYSALISIIEKIAPALATGIGGPAGGMVVSLLENAFGVKDVDLPAAIAADPDAAIKIKQIESQHADTLATLASNDYSTEVGDRENARQREVAIESTGKKDWIEIICALAAVFGFMGMCFVIAFEKLDQSDHDILYMLLGVLGSNFNNIYAYYFGSSMQRK